MDLAPTTSAPGDELDRAFKTYVALPETIDLRLNADGIHLRTTDFPRLIAESAGVDLRAYFSDAIGHIPLLSDDERERLSSAVAQLFSTVSAFVCGKGGVLMQRTAASRIPLPPALTQGFVQEMIVDECVQFRLRPRLPDEVNFSDVSGITFKVGGKVLSLHRLQMQARQGKCAVKPYFDEHASIPRVGSFTEQVLGALKDLLVIIVVKAPGIAVQVPVVVEEFRQWLSAADTFHAMLHEPDKDLIAVCEKIAGTKISDPLIVALLSRARRITKEAEQIELQRERGSVWDLGGLALKMGRDVSFIWRSSINSLQIEKISGVELAFPFEPPLEWQAIGIDLSRTIPKTLIGLRLEAPNANGLRRLVADTAPGCWLSVDLADNMLPAQDAEGNWIIFGAARNPISGTPQRFFVRLDKNNNLNMTAREIAHVVTQTASEGFDPNDPSTWTWAALAFGGRTILAAGTAVKEGSVSGKLKSGARKLGRILGRLMNDI